MSALRVLGRLREARPAIATIMALALVVGLIQVVGKVDLRLGEPSAFTILPDGNDVARLAPITVTFPSAPAERGPENLFRVFPEIPGTYAWMSPRTALFQPDFPGLLRGSTYTVSVPARPDAGLPQNASKKFTVTGQPIAQQVIPGNT